MVGDDEDIKEREAIKNELLAKISKTRYDSVQDAITEYLSRHGSDFRTILKKVSDKKGKNYVRIGCFDFL